MNKIRNDIFLVAGILFAAVLLGVIPHFFYKREPAWVCVIRDGQVLEQYALWEDKTVSISDREYGYNVLVIRHGEVSVSDADCPDKICVRHKAISLNGESIICLPHKLVIQIKSKEEDAPDAFTY